MAVRTYTTKSRMPTLEFRQNSNEVVVSPNTATTYTATRTWELPSGDASGVIANQATVNALLAPNSITNVSVSGALTNKSVNFIDTTAARSMSLPSPSTDIYIVVKDVTGSAAANPITITRPGAQTIDGVAASYVMNISYGSIVIVSDGTNYWII